MNYEKQEIKQGITLHQIQTENYKTNLYAIFIATPLKRENVTLDALISAVLRRGTKNLPSQEQISKKLEMMYGASFNCGIEKTGDNHILKFYLEALSEEFLPKPEELIKESLGILLDLSFNPYTENGAFKAEYVEGEKQNLKQIIEAKIDQKDRYAYDRCTEEMFKGKPYGLYKYGYVEDLESITPESLYKYYQELIATAKIDIFCSGRLKDKNVKEIIEQNENMKNLKERKPNYIINNETTEAKEVTKANEQDKTQKSMDTNEKIEGKENNEIKAKNENVVTESMQIAQGKLVIGLDVNETKENSRFIASVYNAILGGGANSKLFQNVREKNSLAYTANSGYIRVKNVIFIRCGIEIDNYEKALDTIKEQLEDMKNGNFTDEDIKSSKELILASIEAITEEQDTEITYYYGQELADRFVTVEEYAEKIKDVKREQIIDFAKNVTINTIYFLRD